MKGIIMSAESIPGIQDGRNTMTRRVMKPQPLFKTTRRFVFADDVCPKKWEDCSDIIATHSIQPGNILYVKETWKPAIDGYTGISTGSLIEERYFYKASCVPFNDPYNPWRSPMFMPRAAARIFLRVTGVRVERLQEISEEDAKAEGCWMPCYDAVTGAELSDNRTMFSFVWDGINAKKGYPWANNPWVWVYTFERVSKDVAEKEGAA